MGFFSIQKNKIKVAKVIVQTEYCAIVSIIIIAIALIMGTNIGSTTVLNSIVKLIAIPVSGMWWYVPVYLLLCFIAPLINQIILPLGKHTMIVLIVLMWGLWYGLGNLCTAPLYILQKGVFFYTVGAYLRLHENSEKKVHIYQGIILTVLWLIGVICAWFSCKISISSGQESMQFRMMAFFYSTFVVPGCAIELFKIFNAIQIQSDKINSIAKTTFGIYLLHDSVPARTVVWDKLFHVKSQYQTQSFPLYMIGSILIIYVCFGIVMYLWNTYAEERVTRKIQNVVHFIKEKEIFYNNV